MNTLPKYGISDLHLNHVNIVKYANRPNNHNELIVANWNRLITVEDTVLCLGDVLMGPRNLWGSFYLPGKVTVLDSGNHDEPHKRKFMEDEWGWVFVPDFTFDYKGWRIHFSHYPYGTQERADARNNTHLEIVRPLGEKEISIHGHCHDTPEISPRHVSLCVEHTNYTPVVLTDVIEARIKLLEGK